MAEGALPDARRESILRAFFDDHGRLTQIPAREGKRRVVLDALAGAFEIGRRYPEAQVNELLNAFHPDHAALRRYLVEAGFLSRDHGVYWRTGGTADVDG